MSFPCGCRRCASASRTSATSPSISSRSRPTRDCRLKHIEPDALERLKRYRWPGNIRELENLTRRLAALYPQDAVTAQLIDVELAISAPPLTQGFSVAGGGGRSQEHERAPTLASAMERHLSELFRGHGDSLPPPGLYHRILRELEYPLISAALAATRGNQIKAAELLGLNRNTLRKKVRDLDIRLMRSPARRRSTASFARIDCAPALARAGVGASFPDC